MSVQDPDSVSTCLSAGNAIERAIWGINTLARTPKSNACDWKEIDHCRNLWIQNFVLVTGIWANNFRKLYFLHNSLNAECNLRMQYIIFGTHKTTSRTVRRQSQWNFVRMFTLRMKQFLIVVHLIDDYRTLRLENTLQNLSNKNCTVFNNLSIDMQKYFFSSFESKRSIN